MAALDPQTCEVQVEGKWRLVSLDEAVSCYAEAVKRCRACRGRVSIDGVYSGPSFGKTMRDWRAHSGCPLKPETFSGTTSPQPQALT